MNLQLAFLLRCKGCNVTIVLPRQSPLGNYVGQKYLTKGTWPITLGCTYCGRVSEYSFQEVQHETVEALIHTPHSEALWEIELRCGQPDCGNQRTIYTAYLANSTLRDVAETLAEKNPAILCEHNTGVWQNLRGGKYLY